MDNKQKQKARLHNWSPLTYRDGLGLVGTVEGHPKLRDGSDVTTSELVAIAWRKGEGGGVAETLNTVYELVGDPGA